MSAPTRDRIVTVSVTEAGAELASRLPFEHRHRDLAATVAALWDQVDGLVLVCAMGIAVRTIAPLLTGKDVDPGVVCLDDAGRWAVAVTGGHAGGANELARRVAGLTGAEPVVTTASDGAGLPALDSLPGLRASGDVAGVTRAWLDGNPPTLDVDDPLRSWPLPPALVAACPIQGGRSRSRVVVTDLARDEEDGVVVLRPPSLVLGIGSSSGADAGALRALVDEALASAGLDPGAVGVVATLDRKAAEPAIVALAAQLGAPLRSFGADSLREVDVPTPSTVVDAAVGTPSVAEAAALVAAGPAGELVVAKQKSHEATVAVARRATRPGSVAVVGLGPGSAALRTPMADAAVRNAEVVIGYDLYVELAAELLGPHHEVVRSPIGAEADRCAEALSRASQGQRVALVCSGDPGVFAMASLVCELAPAHGSPQVEIVPGVTAALAGAALLGAPLGHDHAAISLSDLLTSWSAIEARVEAVAQSDLVVSFYNPRSNRRTWQLERALEILSRHRGPETPAAILTDIARPSQRIRPTTIAALDPAQVDMLSLVVIGSSTTRWIDGRMVTPRGYEVPT